jgi:hypothetical protein
MISNALNCCLVEYPRPGGLGKESGPNLRLCVHGSRSSAVVVCLTPGFPRMIGRYARSDSASEVVEPQKRQPTYLTPSCPPFLVHLMLRGRNYSFSERRTCAHRY